MPGIHGLRTDGGRVTFEAEADALTAALTRLAAAGVRGLVSSPPTLEELFLRHYDRTDGNGAPAAAAGRGVRGAGSAVGVGAGEPGQAEAGR